MSDDTRQAALEEYRALKFEQVELIKARNALVYSTLVAIGFVGAGVAQTKESALLLVLPFACAVLGWTRLRKDLQIVYIRVHIRETLAPRVAGPDEPPAFPWEIGPRSLMTKVGQLASDLISFVLPGLTGVLIWILLGQEAGWRAALLSVAAGIGVVVSVALGTLIVTAADLSGRKEGGT